MPAPAAHSLTRREREIMDILFSLGEASADDVRARLSNPPGYSAVRAMLVRLEAKAHIRHRESGLRYVYAPATSPVSARRMALRQYLQTYFGGATISSVRCTPAAWPSSRSQVISGCSSWACRRTAGSRSGSSA
jgi:BlaI family penicillinase repressor